MARRGPVDRETRRHFAEHLERMGLAEPNGVKEKLLEQLLLKAL